VGGWACGWVGVRKKEETMRRGEGGYGRRRRSCGEEKGGTEEGGDHAERRRGVRKKGEEVPTCTPASPELGSDALVVRTQVQY
jgi:hypothetical protein